MLFLFSISALDGAFYMIVIYFTPSGVLCLLNTIADKREDKKIQTAGFIAKRLPIIIGAVLLLCLCYLLPIMPLYLSSLLTAVSIIGLILVLCLQHGNEKRLCVAISVSACTASVVAPAFSFGFGVDSTSGFVRIGAYAVLLFGVCMIKFYQCSKKLVALNCEREEK